MSENDSTADDAVPLVRVISGDPTADELAAVTAVLRAAIDENGADARRADAGPSAWQRSQRPIRRPLEPGRGAWRGFTGN